MVCYHQRVVHLFLRWFPLVFLIHTLWPPDSKNLQALVLRRPPCIVAGILVSSLVCIPGLNYFQYAAEARCCPDKGMGEATLDGG